MLSGVENHPKIRHLARLLDVPRPHALGLMQLLWQFSYEYCPTGSLANRTATDVAVHLDWDGDPQRLLEAMVDARFIDRVRANGTVFLALHDCWDWCEKKQRTKLKKRGLTFWNGSPPFAPKNWKKKAQVSQMTQNGEQGAAGTAGPEPGENGDSGPQKAAGSKKAGRGAKNAAPDSAKVEPGATNVEPVTHGSGTGCHRCAPPEPTPMPFHSGAGEPEPGPTPLPHQAGAGPGAPPAAVGPSVPQASAAPPQPPAATPVAGPADTPGARPSAPPVARPADHSPAVAAPPPRPADTPGARPAATPVAGPADTLGPSPAAMSQPPAAPPVASGSGSGPGEAGGGQQRPGIVEELARSEAAASREALATLDATLSELAAQARREPRTSAGFEAACEVWARKVCTWFGVPNEAVVHGEELSRCRADRTDIRFNIAPALLRFVLGSPDMDEACRWIEANVRKSIRVRPGRDKRGSKLAVFKSRLKGRAILPEAPTP